MANPCGCGGSSSNPASTTSVSIPIAQQDQPVECPVIVHAADLNVLSGATCDFATTAIAAANSF